MSMDYVGGLKCILMVMGLFEGIIYLFSWSLVLDFLKHPSEYITFRFLSELCKLKPYTQVCIRKVIYA